MKKLGKIKLLAIACLSAVVLIVASVAVAQSVKTHRGRGQRGAWMGRGFHGGGAFKQLNLTDDQKAKMKQIRQSSMESNKPLLEQLQAKRQELRQASEGGTFNEALATQKLTEMAGLQAKAMGARFALHQQMLAILTTEQKAQLDQLKAQFKAHRGPRRGEGGPRDNE
ncbi:MAG TPA: Spy/CpxP family protein refolding chaperone [Pyrinomonadaceae bacterium]